LISFTPAPEALLKTLAALIPRTYGAKQVVDVNLNGGVRVVPLRRSNDEASSAPPPAAAATKVLPTPEEKVLPTPEEGEDQMAVEHQPDSELVQESEGQSFLDNSLAGFGPHVTATRK
jgi:hypothetical protein